MRFGRRAGLAEYALLLLVAFAVPAALALRHGAPWVALPLLAAPVGAKLFRDLVRGEGRALNATLAGTAKLLLLHGVLFAAGLALGLAS